jgi:putative hydrolase of the HAD superfamily
MADEAVFIDNTPGNLVAANSLGIHTVWHDDEKNDIKALMARLTAYGVHIEA